MNERLFLGDVSADGFGSERIVLPATTGSPWGMAVATSMLSAVTGWALDGVWRSLREKK